MLILEERCRSPSDPVNLANGNMAILIVYVTYQKRDIKRNTTKQGALVSYLKFSEWLNSLFNDYSKNAHA